MSAVRKGWTRQQLLIAFGLYCKMPFGKLHSRNPEIIKFAENIGRTPSALAMKLTNIASLDPAIISTGRKGLKGASAADRNMWKEMENDWENFFLESEKSIASVLNDEEQQEDIFLSDYSGKTKIVQTTARVGQSFFRSAVLSAYNSKCCITGLSETRLLVASHIIPWREDESNRLNPRNGLLLSMLHDKAFDLGIMTINDDMTIHVSKKNTAKDRYFDTSIGHYDGKQITLPEKFQPDANFLAYHRKNIFEK
ncbi:Possible restriction endonuclease [uncultured Candidatus Thioglobus sp.]|nr:Possible restriction endonuclease [uncultured Candidatus Thioglobus sp.]